jgi:23S rRNA (cytidine1920-2'-O)/16S rRNA (cytidine1409-2'-O)-methyltransferase
LIGTSLRADQLLVQRGLASSRSQAQRLIATGARFQRAGEWKVLSKSDDLPEDAVIELSDTAEARYVSRGGLKLEGALKSTGLDVTGLFCLDVGQSTGGFTDCLVKHGAAHVIGVDVGQGQLHPLVEHHERVTCIESVNARALTADDLGEAWTQPFDLVVGDLSFISMTLVLPALVPLMADHAQLLMLVKPQFELQPPDIGKGGIVRDPALYAQVEKRIRDACAALSLEVLQWLDSPIDGGDGNREFFVHARRVP